MRFESGESVPLLQAVSLRTRLRWARSLLWCGKRPKTTAALQIAAAVVVLLFLFVGIPALQHGAGSSAFGPGCDSLSGSLQARTPAGGWVVFYCAGPNGWDPVVVASGNVTARPIFALPPPWIGLYLHPAPFAAGDSCADTAISIPLDSGRALVIPRGGYVYCASFGPTNAALPNFSVTWAQA